MMPKLFFPETTTNFSSKYQEKVNPLLPFIKDCLFFQCNFVLLVDLVLLPNQTNFPFQRS